MAPRFLFLHGGAEQARRVFCDEGRGDWSQALPLVLEKYGFLGVDEVTPEQLGEAHRQEEIAGLLVPRLRDGAGYVDLIKRIAESGCPVFIEGPVHPSLHELVGVAVASATSGEGTVGAVTRLADGALRYGHPPTSRVAPPSVREVSRTAATDWMTLRVPIAIDQAKAWRAVGWDAEVLAVASDVEVVATWTDATGGRSPAIIRRNNVFASSFSLFAVLGQAHTAEPWYHGEYRSSTRVTGLETLLLSIVDEMHRMSGVARMRLLPWPRAARWVLNVRHDFDRFIDPESVSEVLAGHARNGSAATWYWRSRHLKSGLRHARWNGNVAVKLVARTPHHEVALHTEQLFNGAEREREVVQKVIGRPIVGASAHGDPDCFRFQGAPNVMWAEQQGLLYTELIQHAHYHPHRFAGMLADGTMTRSSVVMLPHHESLDVTSRDGHADVERIGRAGEVFGRVGGMLQVMNHPDINQQALHESLEGLSSGGRLDWTAAQTADWWRRTHSRDSISAVLRRDGGYELRSREAIAGLGVEVMEPSGASRTVLVDLAPGEARRVGPSGVALGH